MLLISSINCAVTFKMFKAILHHSAANSCGLTEAKLSASHCQLNFQCVILATQLLYFRPRSYAHVILAV